MIDLLVLVSSISRVTRNTYAKDESSLSRPFQKRLGLGWIAEMARTSDERYMLFSASYASHGPLIQIWLFQSTRLGIPIVCFVDLHA
jgi:hypothetical protein